MCDAVFEFRVDPTSSLCEFKTAVWLIIITMTTVPNSPTALPLQQRCCNGTEGSLRKLPQRPRSCLVLSYVACMLYVVCCMDSRRLRAWLRRLASHRHVRQRTTAAYDATDNTQHNKRHDGYSRACRVQVGYGDQYPVTILGRVAIIVSLGFSVVLSAMLVNTIIKKCAPTPEYH